MKPIVVAVQILLHFEVNRQQEIALLFYLLLKHIVEGISIKIKLIHVNLCPLKRTFTRLDQTHLVGKSVFNLKALL